MRRPENVHTRLCNEKEVLENLRNEPPQHLLRRLAAAEAPLGHAKAASAPLKLAAALSRW